jgi:uncharacterized LabA/DUF88 family protein
MNSSTSHLQVIHASAPNGAATAHSADTHGWRSSNWPATTMPVHPPRHARDTAVLIDLENLVGGYGTDLGVRAEQLSLAGVIAKIDAAARSTGLVDGYSVKRIYGDWSRTQLAPLRRELVDQGLEPRQVFGFSSGRPNSADVELVIDALEIAHAHLEVSTFVIVSGDGGFGTLVRKLHELGRSVVVGAYSTSAGRPLTAVADAFVALDEFSPMQSRDDTTPACQLRAEFSELLRSVTTNDDATLPELHGTVVAAMDKVAEHRGLSSLLTSDGLRLTELGKCFGDRLGRDRIAAHAGNLSGLLTGAFAGTQWALATDPRVRGSVFVVLRDNVPAGSVLRADPECAELSAALEGVTP